LICDPTSHQHSWRRNSDGTWRCVVEWALADVSKDQNVLSNYLILKKWTLRYYREVRTTQPTINCHIPKDMNFQVSTLSVFFPSRKIQLMPTNSVLERRRLCLQWRTQEFCSGG